MTEARNPRGSFYPLTRRLTELATTTSADAIRPDLLEVLREDLLRHAGASLADDAALILIRAPAAWS